MSIKPEPRFFSQILKDAAIGLVLFVTVAFGMLGVPSSNALFSSEANAAETMRVVAFTGPMSTAAGEKADAVETIAAPPAMLVSEPSAWSADRVRAVLMMAGLFATAFAFNMAFFRHLKQVYARPRHRSRRRG